MSVDVKSHKITVVFEIPLDMTKEQLHEALCKTIHELDESQNHVLMDTVIDINIED